MGVTQKVKPKKAKKKYVPKAIANPVKAFDTLNKLSLNKWVTDDFNVPIPQDTLDVAETGFAICLDRLSKMQADAGDIGHLGYMVNMTLVLCENGFGAEYVQQAQAGQEAVLKAMQRGLDGHSFGVTGDELKALRTTYQVHRAQAEVAGRGHIIAASKEVERRQKTGAVVKLGEELKAA